MVEVKDSRNIEKRAEEYAKRIEKILEIDMQIKRLIEQVRTYYDYYISKESLSEDVLNLIYYASSEMKSPLYVPLYGQFGLEGNKKLGKIIMTLIST